MINQSSAEAQLLAQHQSQLKRWQAAELDNGLRVRAVNACDLPPRQAGVGLARKIGMDLALGIFAQIKRDGLIVNLDADCKVAQNYLEVLGAYADGAGEGGSIYYEHPLDGLKKKHAEAIMLYELWLRYYSQALRWANYPHWHQTIGSAMFCRASLYARAGGMNRRKAAEDFYFLHKIMPLCRFVTLTSTTVYPSARNSQRVPFGTGRAMLEQAEGMKDFSRLYHPQIFRDLKQVLRKAPDLKDTCWPDFLAAHPRLNRSYQALLARSGKSFRQNFHHWLDGFAVLKFVHWREQFHTRTDWQNAISLVTEVSHLHETLQRLRLLEKQAANW